MTNKIVTNKVWLIKKLNLPIELTDEISSYCFYDLEMTTTRNIFRSITHIFNSSFMDRRRFWAEYDDGKFQGLNCSTCGNYISTNWYNIPINIICSCVYVENTDRMIGYYENYSTDENYPTIEDIENEEEDYRNYRESRRELSRSW